MSIDNLSFYEFKDTRISNFFVEYHYGYSLDYQILNYVELYYHLSRVESMDTVVMKYEGIGFKNFLYTEGFNPDFKDWLMKSKGVFFPIREDFLGVIEEYIIFKYKDKYRQEVLNDLTN